MFSKEDTACHLSPDVLRLQLPEFPTKDIVYLIGALQLKMGKNLKTGHDNYN